MLCNLVDLEVAAFLHSGHSFPVTSRVTKLGALVTDNCMINF